MEGLALAGVIYQTYDKYWGNTSDNGLKCLFLMTKNLEKDNEKLRVITNEG